ncbi:MAG: hypothetical protein ACK47C_04780 [Paracoccaceae bacterium]|jgi:hypothetical protein
MSGMKDPFEILADESTLIWRQMDQLRRTCLNREEAEALNARVVQAVADMQKTGTTVQRVLQHDLAKAALDVRAHSLEAAKGAAREAIEASHAESLKAARNLAQAAGEARRQAWRHFGGSGCGSSLLVRRAPSSARWQPSGSSAAATPTGSADIPASTAASQVDRSSSGATEAATAPYGSTRRSSGHAREQASDGPCPAAPRWRSRKKAQLITSGPKQRRIGIHNASSLFFTSSCRSPSALCIR